MIQFFGARGGCYAGVEEGGFMAPGRNGDMCIGRVALWGDG